MRERVSRESTKETSERRVEAMAQLAPLGAWRREMAVKARWMRGEVVIRAPRCRPEAEKSLARP